MNARSTPTSTSGATGPRPTAGSPTRWPCSSGTSSPRTSARCSARRAWTAAWPSRRRRASTRPASSSRSPTRHPFVKAVVGWVDLLSPDLERELDAFAAHRHLRGVRHVAQDEPDDRWLARPDVVRGVGTLRRCDLAYDILVYARQLPAAFALARALPDQPFVVDHIAKPEIRAKRARAVAERPAAAGRAPARPLQALRARDGGRVGPLDARGPAAVPGGGARAPSAPSG